MKDFGYQLFALIYHIFIIFGKPRSHRIVLWNGHDHGLTGNLRELAREIHKRNDQYQFFVLAKHDLFRYRTSGRRKPIWGLIKDGYAFFVRLPYAMATAGTVFLNDNFLPLGYMHTKKTKTRFVQLWHGAGAFKRFGLSTEEDRQVYATVKRANQNITHLFVTSGQVVPYYEEAFGVSSDRIFVTGLPESDRYFQESRRAAGKKHFFQNYPELVGKKLLLYTPTFRRTSEENRQLLKQFDVKRIHEALGDDWCILLRFHPKYPVDELETNDYCYNVTDYSELSELFFVSELLITDYSSTVVEYALLHKPVILFAYDLAQYDRGFYFDYEAMVPGPVAHNQAELIELLQKDWQNMEKQQTFVKFEYDNMDGHSCDRILDILAL